MWGMYSAGGNSQTERGKKMTERGKKMAEFLAPHSICELPPIYSRFQQIMRTWILQHRTDGTSIIHSINQSINHQSIIHTNSPIILNFFLLWQKFHVLTCCFAFIWEIESSTYTHYVSFIVFINMCDHSGHDSRPKLFKCIT